MTTAPISCSTVSPSTTSSSPTVSLTRRRRRRTPASGAAADCFACSKRNTKCDRRRPYCSPCLDVGDECSGYKTQLTWGVGVASRGKLRGLSLPVARSAPAAKSPPPTSRARAGSSTSRTSTSRVKVQDDDVSIKIKVESPRQQPDDSCTTYNFINMSPRTARHIPTPSSMNDGWHQMSQDYRRPPSAALSEISAHQELLRQSLQRLNTPAMGLGEVHPVPLSALSAGQYSETAYSSPMQHAFQVDDAALMHSPAPMYNQFSCDDSLMNHGCGLPVDMRGPTSCPENFYPQSELSSSLSSHPTTLFEAEISRQLTASPAGTYMGTDLYFADDLSALVQPLGTDETTSSSLKSEQSWTSIPAGHYVRSSIASEPAPLSYSSSESGQLSLRPEISTRLDFYLKCYDKVICPITVAIDSPNNPYRSQILALATDSEALQHAICALASCNLRMRRRQGIEAAHRSADETQGRFGGQYYQLSNVRSTADLVFETPEDEAAAQEEFYHRTQAVQLLNASLSDPSQARHDSVLATLFILCHYRMCETGIAQFKTQFAGVKKIMGMRASGVETGMWNWMESLFIFFDAITATVNDREAQLSETYLEMMAYPASSYCATDNLVGCDGKLFKVIAGLGRLNLMSQRRSVISSRATSRSPTAAYVRPRLSGQALVDYYRVNPHKFDGNGFTTLLPEAGGPISTMLPSTSPHTSSVRPDELRTTFWQEWQSTRVALETWSFDSLDLLASLPATASVTANTTRDFNCVSEAFRHAALLYIERLANVAMPATTSLFQVHVQRALDWVRGLSAGSTAEKFLLWPLFVVGSECVEESQRQEIVDRIRSIGGRGGYGNNLAALSVLQKIWREDVLDLCLEDAGLSPFKWTKYMEGQDGELIMA